MDDELKLAVGSAVSGRVLEFRDFYDWTNIGRLLSHGAGVGGTFARVSDIVEDKNFIPAVFAAMDGYAASALRKKTGLDLESVSEEGLARAIGKRAGFVLRSLHDQTIITEDLIRAAADRIEARLNVRFERVVKTGDELIAAMERRAALEIEKRVPGLVLHDLLDAQTTEDDFAKWAADRITAKTGIPLRDIRDVEKTKRDIIKWAEPEIRRRLKISGSSKGGGLKMTKKGIRNRAAQRRFYAAHGNRKIYERL